MPALIDSNVFLDLMSESKEWFVWSSDALDRTARRTRLVINPIVYAEISIRFSRQAELDAILPTDLFERENLPYEAAFAAGKAFAAYKRRGGAKTSPLPDFLIGAHAAVAGYELLTRDARRYRTYFPEATLITPT